MKFKTFEHYFAKKLFQAGGKRNRLIIVTLALSVLLPSMVIYFFRYVVAYNQINNMKNYGTEAEAEYLGGDYDDYLSLRASGECKDLSYGAYYPISINVDGKVVSLSLCYFEEKAAEWGFAGLLSGSWPQQEKEIVVSQAFCEDVENVSVGEEIYLEPLQESFLVSGISKSERVRVYFSHSKWCRLPFFEDAANIIYVRLSSVVDAEEKLSAMARQFLGTTDISWRINSAYSQEGELELYYNRIATLLLFSVITFLFVYSVYYFALFRDLKMYSSLRLLGMSAGQLQSIVKYQAYTQFLIGVPVGVALSLMLCLAFRIWADWRTGMHLAVHPQVADYMLAICVTALAMLAGLGGPIRMMGRMSGIQAYRYQPVKRIRSREHKNHRFSPVRMAIRNIKRNTKRSALVGICMALVAIVFVVNVNLMKSISCYDDYLYATDYDFVVARRGRLAELSHYQGVEQPEDNIDIMGRLGWWFNDEMVSTDAVEKQVAQEMRSQCEGAQLICYFSLDAAISDPDYEARVREAMDKKLFCKEQEEYYGVELDYFGYLSQQQYYVDFSELEKCELIEGILDRELFESGGYTVLIYDGDLESEPIYHAGERMVVGKRSAAGLSQEKNIIREQELQESQREVEVMAVVKDPPEMYFVTGMNACFLPVNSADVWKDEEIMLYAMTIEADDIEKTESAVQSVIGMAEADDEFFLSYLSEEMKEKQKNEDLLLYKVLCGGIGGILCVVAFLNLLNNAMLGMVERREELATLHAIGMTKAQLRSMLRTENVLITGLGAVAGYGLGMLLSKRYMIVMYGEYIGFTNYIRYSWWPGLVLIGCVVLFSCIYPNRKTRFSFER